VTPCRSYRDNDRVSISILRQAISSAGVPAARCPRSDMTRGEGRPQAVTASIDSSRAYEVSMPPVIPVARICSRAPRSGRAREPARRMGRRDEPHRLGPRTASRDAGPRATRARSPSRSRSPTPPSCGGSPRVRNPIGSVRSSASRWVPPSGWRWSRRAARRCRPATCVAAERSPTFGITSGAGSVRAVDGRHPAGRERPLEAAGSRAAPAQLVDLAPVALVGRPVTRSRTVNSGRSVWRSGGGGLRSS
jgi:hypothetical protein